MKSIITLCLSVFLSLGTIAQEKQLSPKEMKVLMKKEAYRTNPDYVCFIPGSYDFSTHDSHNEHFLAFDGPDGSLMAIWTQAVGIGEKGNRNRIVFSRSDDEGKTWTQPLHLTGPKQVDDPVNIASWAFPMVSKSGRIYVLWNQNQGVAGWIFFHTGTMSGIFSDDNGKTWSEPQDIPMLRSPYDDPSGKIPGEWIVWQKPERGINGKYFVGYSRWVNEAFAFYNKKNTPGGWTWIESVVEFMRFDNIDDNPEPRDIRITYSAWGDQALRVPHFLEPRLSIAQEPSIVRLPDNRLFCVMRTGSGCIWYSVSEDNGMTWSNTQPLLRKDHGEPILQPVSCCPIYQLADGRYILIHHNHAGFKDPPDQIHSPRNPAYIALGEFRLGADQPVWFSESKEFLNNNGRGPDGKITERSGVAIYTSFTVRDEKNILWYPDAKCWLLGKEITDEVLKGLKVPE